MGYLDYLIDKVIARAIDEISRQGLSGQIVTMALYFDHEGAALSVCADTLENSLAHEEKARDWSYRHLSEAIIKGDLTEAALFNHSVSRSLSLGDFVLINLARYDLEPDDDIQEMPENFFVALAQSLNRNTKVCLSVCALDVPVVFACSTANNEVGLVWTPPRP
ncbi:MAG: hypothetical protein CFE34_15450 [Rhodobacteraceae bacterium PARR1]|nr:MAG: hypothetical protein CFE34_15450 [Rhodobacteraceae bacterium PARR1]